MSQTVADLLVGVLERLEPAFHRTRPQRKLIGNLFELQDLGAFGTRVGGVSFPLVR